MKADKINSTAQVHIYRHEAKLDFGVCERTEIRLILLGCFKKNWSMEKM